MSDIRLAKMTNERLVALSTRLNGTLNEFRRDDDDEREGGSIVVPAVAGTAVGVGGIVAGQAVKKDYAAHKSGMAATAKEMRGRSVAIRGDANASAKAGVLSTAGNLNTQADKLRAGAKSAAAAASPLGYVKSKLGMAGHAAAPAAVSAIDGAKKLLGEGRKRIPAMFRK